MIAEVSSMTLEYLCQAFAIFLNLSSEAIAATFPESVKDPGLCLTGGDVLFSSDHSPFKNIW